MRKPAFVRYLGARRFEKPSAKAAASYIDGHFLQTLLRQNSCGCARERRHPRHHNNAHGKIKFAREICGVLAGIYTALGDRDRAFSLPEIALAKRDAALLALHQHPEFDPIRSDPRFLDLLRRTGLRQ